MTIKSIILSGIIAYNFTLETYAQNTLTKLWETQPELPVPESVLFNPKEELLYTALIDGKAGEKDGKGGIAKVALDGNIMNAGWVTGLNAPKGMGLHNGNLYVTDITEVVEIDTESGKVIKKIEIPDSKFLNDLTIDSEGIIYVSDSETHKVHVIKNGVAATLSEDFTRPNGLLAVGNDLLVADAGALKKLSNNTITTLAEGMDKSTDGIEEVKPGEYIVSCWTGVIYYVKADGAIQQLIDTRENKVNSADIGYDKAKKIVYVPTFLKNSVAAYQLK